MGCLFSCCCIPEGLAHFLYEMYAFLTCSFYYTAVPVSTTAIKVHWVEPSGEYNFYKIQYRHGHHNWKKVDIRERGHHSKLLCNLEPGTEYEISIKDKSLSPADQQWLEPVFASTHNLVTPERRGLLHGAQNV